MQYQVMSDIKGFKGRHYSSGQLGLTSDWDIVRYDVKQ